MKKLFLVNSILVLFLLSACAVDLSTPLPIVNIDTVATIVAATLSAIPSPSPIPTETLIPTQTVSPMGQWLTWSSYMQKEQAQYMFQLEFDTNQWKLENDDTQSVYRFKRFKQYLLNKQNPECAIIQTVPYGYFNPEEYSLEDGPKNINGIAFDTTSVKLNEKLVFVIYSTALNLDNSYSTIFVMGGSDNCLASGEQVLSTLKAVNVEDITPMP